MPLTCLWIGDLKKRQQAIERPEAKTTVIERNAGSKGVQVRRTESVSENKKRTKGEEKIDGRRLSEWSGNEQRTLVKHSSSMHAYIGS